MTLNSGAPLQFFAVSLFRRNHPMFGVQVQSVAALHREAVLRPTSILVAGDDAVLAQHD